jgi:glycolate oxidase iron-sulfur subunit
MQTNFRPEQLADPRLAEAEEILRRCVHCGLCTATCSTYVMLGDERDSPRGRIYLIKDMLEAGKGATPEVQHHVDRCLSCLSCMTTCPGGVDYMHLVDIARVHIEETGKRPLRERLARNLLAAVVPYPERFKRALSLAALGRPFAPLMKRLGLKELVAMLELAPRAPLPKPKFSGPGTAHSAAERRKRVLLLPGCAQQVLRPEINDATIRLLAKRGVEVVVAPNTGCCGALVHHIGKEATAIEQAKANVRTWSREISRGPVDAIIINASGCGTMVKDYGHLLRRDSEHAAWADKIAGMTKDVTEFLAGYDFGPPVRWSSLRVAYHSACSMQHGQRIHAEPRALLRKAGFAVTEIPEGHICCGSAGTYNILQPELAADLKQRKIENIRRAKADLVATGNIGCITQLSVKGELPIVHTIELLDWAYGGPVPRGLEALKDRVKDVPGVSAPVPA